MAALVDHGSFREYGRHAVAAQLGRQDLETLLQRTPADGLVAGLADVNSGLVGSGEAKAVVLAYDALTLAGTQGYFNHIKLDRMLELAEARG